jgi:hypothetical protein
MSITVADIMYFLGEYEPSDKLMIRTKDGLYPVEEIQLEIPEPLSMFDEPERCCVLLIKEES